MRYTVFDEIASGGMATVHFGRLQGPVGFSRTVAIKRLHPQYAKSPEFVAMFLDEARLAARIRHPNVVSTLDVVALEGELFVVMEYVQGESLARLLRQSAAAGARPPPSVVASVLGQVLLGLHAAHEATSDRGEALHVVHRDVSPQNVLVGIDGVARVLDFGVAKATSRLQTTDDGALKAKVAYMSPEQLLRRPVDRRTDIFAASVILWEALTGQRLFAAEHFGGSVAKILEGRVERPSALVRDLAAGLDEVVLRGLAMDPEARFATAREMAEALESVLPSVNPLKVGDWVQSVAKETLRERADIVARIEEGTGPHHGLKADVVGDILSARRASGTPPKPSLPTIAERVSREHEETARAVHADVVGAALRKRRQHRILGGMAVIAVSALAGVGFGFLRRGEAQTKAPAAAPSNVVALAPSAAAPQPPIDAPAPDPSAAPAPSPPPPAPRAAARAPEHAAKPATRASTSNRRADCDIPYVIDSDGSKRFKPQCF